MTRATAVTLLRHGKTQGTAGFCGSTNIALSEEGWKQLRSAVDTADCRWTRIVTSPLSRCADFARVLSEEMRLPLCVEERLQEMHFGDWEGQSATDLMETHAEELTKFWENPLLHTPPAAEALRDFQTRVIDAWREMIDRYRGENLLVITHGGVIRTILCHVQQHPIERLLELVVEHASLHRIQVSAQADGLHRYEALDQL